MPVSFKVWYKRQVHETVGQGELTVSGTKDMGITRDFEVIMIISIIQLAEDYERPEKPLELLRIRRILPSSFLNVETRTSWLRLYPAVYSI